MNGEALLLEDKDTSTTIFRSQMAPLRWPCSELEWPRLPQYGSSATVILLVAAPTLEASTSAVFRVVPEEGPASAPEIWLEVDFQFPPKKTRTVAGRIVGRERATFKTAFGDELVKNG